MPTMYANILVISGNPEKIQSFAQKCKGWDRYYPNSEDDYTKEIADFKKKTCSAKFKDYRKTMSAIDANRKALAETNDEIGIKFKPRTEEEIQNAIESNRQKHFAKEPYFCLNVLHPEPESNYGKENWKDWRIENWGCKWANTLGFEVSDNQINISLEAANGYIVPWVVKVSEDFPTLKFDLEWDGRIEIGSCVIKNGEMSMME